MHAYMSFQSTNGWDVSTNIALKSCSWMDKKDQQTADWCVCSVAETRRCICRERCLLHSLSLDMADNSSCPFWLWKKKKRGVYESILVHPLTKPKPVKDSMLTNSIQLLRMTLRHSLYIFLRAFNYKINLTLFEKIIIS